MNSALIISILALVVSALMLALTIKRDNKSYTNIDTSKEIRVAESFKELNVKLDYLTKQLDQLQENSRTAGRDMQELSIKFTELDSKLHTAFERIDENRNRIQKLEGKE